MCVEFVATVATPIKNETTTMNEKLLERKLCEGVKRAGGIALKLICLSFTGLPDRTVLLPGGKIQFAEIKTTGKKPSPRQRIVIGFLQGLGFKVWIVDSEVKLSEFLNDIAK